MLPFEASSSKQTLWGRLEPSWVDASGSGLVLGKFRVGGVSWVWHWWMGFLVSEGNFGGLTVGEG